MAEDQVYNVSIRYWVLTILQSKPLIDAKIYSVSHSFYAC